VAHSLSAKKRIRQNAKRRARNRSRKDVIKEQVKNFTAAIAAGDFKKAGTELVNTVKRLDRVASKGTIHKKAASRKRSRLTKRLNAAVKAAATKPAEGAPAKGAGKGKGRAKKTTGGGASA
jgi:small subunit ribosomal protein S20